MLALYCTLYTSIHDHCTMFIRVHIATLHQEIMPIALWISLSLNRIVLSKVALCHIFWKFAFKLVLGGQGTLSLFKSYTLPASEDAPENYQSVISLKYIHGRQAVLSLSNTINTSSLSTMGLNVISILYEAHATTQLTGWIQIFDLNPVTHENSMVVCCTADAMLMSSSVVTGRF